MKGKGISTKRVLLLVLILSFLIGGFVYFSWQTSPREYNAKFQLYFSCREKGQAVNFAQECCSGLIHYTRGLGRSVNFCEKPGLLVD